MSNNRCENKANGCETQNKPETQRITDVYISVFFDGTGNNMYEQLNKGNHLKELREKAATERNQNLDIECETIQYSIIPDLFTNAGVYYAKLAKNRDKEKLRFGMNDYFEQRLQAEEDYEINNNRGAVDSTDINDNGGLKYSNVAVMRSLAKKKSDDASSDDGIIGVNYNLYIEGAGKNWDVGSDTVALGMGVRKQGVVGLVSKAIIFVQDFLNSNIDEARRKEVNIHFAVFGFSRGATCGRLFSSLVVNPSWKYEGKKQLLKELKEYLPQSYVKDEKVQILEDYNKSVNSQHAGSVTVDFLGLFDTVSSIGFLMKYDNTTNYSINNYVPYSRETSHKKQQTRVTYVNQLHGSSKSDESMVTTASLYGKYGGELIGKILPSDGLFGLVGTAAELGGEQVGFWGTQKLMEKRNNFFGDAMYNFHRDNVKNYCLDPYTNINVKHTFQIGAIDEYRENFALVDLGTTLSEHHCTEILMPGCHSDIGGGYMYNDDIPKYTLRRKICEMDTLISKAVDPRNVNHDNFYPISLSSMKDIGWLTRDLSDADFEDEKRFKIESGGKKIKDTNDATEDTPGQTTFILENEEKIEFERFVKEGYSNIALKLMINRAIGSYGLTGSTSEWPKRFLPFQSDLPRRFDCDKVNQDPILNNIKKKSSSAETVKEGNRYWILCNPDNHEYEDLRRDYLHFTCTDELNPEQDILNYSQWGANVGNPPNWRKMSNYGYLLCRLVYRGNAEENDLHYMSEYRAGGNL